jgi:O-antigen/teichoic acid export membrane protein
MLGLVSVIVLARLLVPEDFGVVAKAAMIASFLELITTFGLEAALIHNQRAVAAHYDTVWTIHVIRGLVIAVVLAILARPAAEFFREPALSTILWFYGLAALLNGLENVGVVDFRKNLTFNKDFRYSLYRKLAGFIVTVTVAYVWRSYWAFVIGVVSSSGVALLASFLMSPYRPRLSLGEWKSLFDFSKWVFFIGLIQSVSSKFDTFVLSRFSTTEEVGQYTVSYELAGTASTEIAMPIARATMPGLAQLNDSFEKFRDTYQRTIAVLLLISVPASLGLSAVAYPTTIVLLGEKWVAAVRIIEILAIFGIFRSISAVSASAFMSSGKVKAMGQLSLFDLVIRVAFLSAGFATGGVVGMAIGVVLAGFVQMLISLVVQQAIGFLRVVDLVSDTWRIFVSGVVMYAAVAYLLPHISWLEDIDLGPLLAIQVTYGALTGRREGPEMNVWTYVRSRSARRDTEAADST